MSRGLDEIGVPLIGGARSGRRVEIARSFSYKLNVPGAYESRDFFCSQKSECWDYEAEDCSQALYSFCRAQVLHDVKQYKADMLAQQQRPTKKEIA